MRFPSRLPTERLILRSWTAADASELLPILEANREHIGPWIPARVAEPVPVPALAERLAGFAESFADDREWRLCITSREDARILGDVGLFPRNATGRVPLAEATCAELGYWLRSDATGRGFIAEAAAAVLDFATTIPQFAHFEIRCDARNAPSSAVARRLGFALRATEAESDADGASQTALQTWVRGR
jgi:RimJ/RimL family protein N-acetyltransferase